MYNIYNAYRMTYSEGEKLACFSECIDLQKLSKLDLVILSLVTVLWKVIEEQREVTVLSWSLVLRLVDIIQLLYLQQTARIATHKKNHY